MIRGASQTCHKRADNRSRIAGTKSDREALTHAPGPVIDEDHDRSPVDESSARRHEFESAAPDSGLKLFRRQDVFLVRQLAADESTKDSSRDAAIAAAGRTP